MRRSPTLSDVALEAGVSAATVSRALARRRSGVPLRSDGAKRAVEAADRLGYRLNTVASALRTRSSRLLGVIVPDLTDVAVSQMYGGFEARAAELGYQTCVANSTDDPRVRASRVETFRAHGVDGIVFADAHLGEHYFSELAADDFPYLLMSRPLPGEISVTCDDAESGRLAARHLAEQGHTDVVVLAGPSHAGNVVARSRGFADAAEGLLESCTLVGSGFDLADAKRALAEYLERSPRPPTAVFATIDMFAFAAVSVLAERGLRIGEEIGVIAVNDSNIAANLPVPLTSVRHELGGMGSKAAEMLTGMIERGPGGERPASIALSPELVVRRSTAFRPGT
ncbi:LacI family DNA-binding transcriptional regulator [Leucobacter sp. CSA1]|uniref:LacI family DNA-binding transcriptional regulator n=1 Tax=Leucobacter chromiisoli TaxID=2796471 RepID=A0A934QA71_9MICO|nr:LacI family DNA-binding transcriptional regulator [Leucobacter chromiisoli]MBK0419607.1 LacI family DNA-binding transcriptional regulator [Leucobacter chromiisoli]